MTRTCSASSRPGRGLLISSIAIGLVTVWLPYSPLADVLGFTFLSATLLFILMGITALYVFAAELTKRVFYARQARHAP